MATPKNRIPQNPLLALPFEGVRMISMHEACLSILKTGGVYRYQFESEADLRAAFSAWCRQHVECPASEEADGLNIAVLRH